MNHLSAPPKNIFSYFTLSTQSTHNNTTTLYSMVRQILKVANFRTVSRCWVPAQLQTQQPMSRYFSSRQRCINFNNINEHDNGVHLISNDDVFATEEVKHQSEAPFEPTVFSSEDVYTAGPVNKA